MMKKLSLSFACLCFVLPAACTYRRAASDIAYRTSESVTQVNQVVGGPVDAMMGKAALPAESGSNAVPVGAPTATTPTSAQSAAPAAAQIEGAQAAAQAYARKLILNANLDVELAQPETAQREVAHITETNGGFVVTSEARKSGTGNVSVNIIVRVPATQFHRVIEALRTQLGEKAGGTILQEKTAGQDVTQEFIDLEARIKTKKALEDQFLVIMRSASKVSDALEVQRQIAEVRGEIEQMEGRRRWLENQSALSTITLHLHTPAPVLVTTSSKGFWHEVKQAFADGIGMAAEIVLGVIRLAIVLIPVLLLIVAPLVWLLRWLWRRKPLRNWARRQTKEATSPSEAA